MCVKPAGIATQTKRIGEKDMESILRTYRVQKGEPPYIGVVHRLDQPVQGVMVFAKTKEAAADLSRQVAAKQADKCYYALVEGVPEPESGSLTDYLLRDGRTNTSRVVEQGTAEAKRAVLSYEQIETDGVRSILNIRLETGRHHQIRVQLSHRGWPIVGDRKYNRKDEGTDSGKTEAGSSNGTGRNDGTSRNGENLALCSYRIGFTHPKTRKKLDFEIPQPFHL